MKKRDPLSNVIFQYLHSNFPFCYYYQLLIFLIYQNVFEFYKFFFCRYLNKQRLQKMLKHHVKVNDLISKLIMWELRTVIDNEAYLFLWYYFNISNLNKILIELSVHIFHFLKADFVAKNIFLNPSLNLSIL